MPLRTLLAVSFATLAFLVGLIGSVMIQQIASVRVQERVGREMARLSGQVRDRFEANLAERLSDLKILSTVSRMAASDHDSRRAWLDAMRSVYPVYAWIGFAGRDGVVRASTGGILEGESVGTRPWFKQGLTAPFFGDVHEAVLLASKLPPDPSGEPLRFVDVAAPLQDASGTIVGAVGAHLGWRWAGEIMRAALEPIQRVEPAIQALVVSAEGEVLLGPPGFIDIPLPSKLAAAVKSTARIDGHSLESWPGDRTFLVGSARSAPRPDGPSLGWTILMLQPVEQAIAASHQLSREIFVVGLALAVAAAFVGWWLAGSIAAPLLRLSDAAATMLTREGALPRANGFSEVKWLTSSISDLLQRLAQREAALAASNRDLENRIAIRTHDLEVAKQRAEDATRAKADFVANISHELRTPLTGILGVHDLLRADPELGIEQARLVDLAQEAGRALLVIVNDILDLSKLEAGQLGIERLSVELRPLLESCRRMAIETASGRPVEVEVEIATDLPTRVMSDPTRLRQIVLNLATNAVKFTPAGHVHIKAGSKNGRLRITVTDSGIGIAPEAMPYLFGRFTQADGSTARRFGGTGLGLAICKMLVELMDGTIGVESEVGTGSVFWFELPLVRDETPCGAAGSVSELLSKGAVGRRLLLVDDNATNRQIISAVLARSGHAVEAVESADMAIASYRGDRFDVVLMDVQMPIRDGLAATREIREIEEGEGRQRTPIIALTANASAEEGERCRAAGMDAHVAKPVDWPQLLAAIDQLCAKRIIAISDRPRMSDIPVMDEAVQETLAGYIGSDRLGALILSFCRDLQHRIDVLKIGPTTSDDISRHAHVLVSMSGQLGFSELSAFCRTLGDGCESDQMRRDVERLDDLSARALRAAKKSRFAA